MRLGLRCFRREEVREDPEEHGGESDGLSAARAKQKVNGQPGLPLVALAWTLWEIVAAYLLLMPQYAAYLNVWYANNTCTMPTVVAGQKHQLGCVDGRNLTRLAVQAGRFASSGGPVVCGCGQGVFGEDICPLGAKGAPAVAGFTISSYLGTPTGAFTFSILNVGPWVLTWMYGTGSSVAIAGSLKVCAARRPTSYEAVVWLSRASLLSFQLASWAFQCLPGCSFPGLHAKLLGILGLSAFVHHSCAALLAMAGGQLVPMTIVLLLGAGISPLFAYQSVEVGSQYRACNFRDDDPTCHGVLAAPRMPWLYEVLAILSQMMTTPALITWVVWQRYGNGAHHGDPLYVCAEKTVSSLEPPEKAEPARPVPLALQRETETWGSKTSPFAIGA